MSNAIDFDTMEITNDVMFGSVFRNGTFAVATITVRWTATRLKQVRSTRI
ncbi:MAG: hypothetical protein ACI4DO_03805 [Roseburia sp.]